MTQHPNTHEPGDRHSGPEVNGAGVSAAVVAGLAREVDVLRRAIRANADLPGRIAALADTVTALADEVNTRRGPAAGSAVSWLDRHAVPDPDPEPEPDVEGEDDARVPPAAGDLLVELVGWVGRVFLRYPDAGAVFPDCWLWHPEIVEELLWLMAGWQLAYQHESATVASAGDWHDRYRPGVVRRIKLYAHNCSLSRHAGQHSSGAPDADETRVPFGEVAERIATWWTTGQTGTGPTPTQEQLQQAAGRFRRDPGVRR